jgi:beta-phosphoglucomutase-like phosphatase (HAD superfamily)
LRPKPDPEIYLKVARKLERDPAACVAFEDSFPGINAARNAGMKCVAIASTFPLEQLRSAGAELAVSSFEQINLEMLRELFRKHSG